MRGRGRPGESKAKPAISEEVSTDLGGKTGHYERRGVHRPACVRRPPGRAPSASACEPYREMIAEALARGRNAVAIWQDLVDDHGFPARYASVRRFVVTLRGSAPAEARVVITTAPGEEGQVDYGEGPMVRDRGTGQVPTHAALRPDARAARANRCGCWCGDRARRSGRSCTSARFVGWAAPSASSSSTI